MKSSPFMKLILKSASPFVQKLLSNQVINQTKFDATFFFKVIERSLKGYFIRCDRCEGRIQLRIYIWILSSQRSPAKEETRLDGRNVGS